MGLATTSSGSAAAVSTVTAPFAPGQFLQLTGEALLGRSGFDNMPSGCRIAAATTPISSPAVSKDARWRTYFDDATVVPVDHLFYGNANAEVIVGHSLVARALGARENPYLSRMQKVSPNPASRVSILPAGMSMVRRVDDGAAVLADLGVLTASEAGRVAEAVNSSGSGSVTAVAVGVM
jgi:hypothetical protein